MNNLFKKMALVCFLILMLGCSKEDIANGCTPIICLNGGIPQADCKCDCPNGYGGLNCGTQLTPSKILITKIRVVKFPNLKSNGAEWDENAIFNFIRPDIFPVLFDSENNVIWIDAAIQDAFSNGNDQFYFIPSTPISITNLTSTYNLYLFDEDSSTTSEIMGGWTSMQLYSSTGGFPSTLIFGQASDAFIFELSLEYVW
jgi:hypothetical protein